MMGEQLWSPEQWLVTIGSVTSFHSKKIRADVRLGLDQGTTRFSLSHETLPIETAHCQSRN